MLNDLDEEVIKEILDFLFKGRDSVFFLIIGFNQIGKTDLMLFLMENLFKFNYVKYYGLNQHIENAKFEWDYIRDLKTLLKRCSILNKPYFYFLDELAKSANKSTAWEKTNIGLIKALEVRRKYKLHIGGAGIGEIDRRIASPLHVDAVIEKKSLTTAVIHHLQKHKDYWMYDIPKTSIGYKQYQAAEFLPEPLQETTKIQDIDIRIALSWARGEKYTGDLSKPSYYDQIRRGIKKLNELAELGS